MSSESPTKSVKQRLLEQQGQKAPLDLFLFACWEQEKTLKALARGDKNQVNSSRPAVVRGWLGVHDKGQPAPGGEEFVSLWTQCCLWYKDQYPELASSQTLDHEVLSGLVSPVVDLYNDLCALFYRCHQKSLPYFPVAKPSKLLAVPDAGAEPVALPQEESPWPQILQVLDGTMGSVNSWVREYLIWTFREEVAEFFAPGSRPPVGKFAPPSLRREGSFGSRPRGRDGREGRDGVRERGDRERGDRTRGAADREVEVGLVDAPPTEGGFRESGEGRARGRGRGERESGGGRRPSEFRSPRGGERPKSGGWTGDRDRGRPKVSAEETQKNSDAALAEVDQAIRTLESQPSLNEVRLTPQNSFYRRIQHQKIVDAGFVSQSVGEGPSRAVTISRQSAE